MGSRRYLLGSLMPRRALCPISLWQERRDAARRTNRAVKDVRVCTVNMRKWLTKTYFSLYVHLFLLWYNFLLAKDSWICCAAVFTVAELV